MDGKAEVELTLADPSEQVKAKLRALGLEIISWPKESAMVVGRIAVEKLESLLSIEAVHRIAQHYR
ncbi:MAG: hypothetical protein JXA73_07400 [Acidobacteria bacterium]|nr:hypothetical protein [Acidobacteriota bacterium]